MISVYLYITWFIILVQNLLFLNTCAFKMDTPTSTERHQMYIIRVYSLSGQMWGYFAFLIVTLLQRLLVCPLQPGIFLQSFSNSGHMSLVPRSRCQWILGALRFHLWPTGGQKLFFFVHFRDLSFQLL